MGIRLDRGITFFLFKRSEQLSITIWWSGSNSQVVTFSRLDLFSSLGHNKTPSTHHHVMGYLVRKCLQTVFECFVVISEFGPR